MIRELIEYILTPCPREYRRSGHLREIIGIGARYRRQAEAWEPHLKKTREIILQAAEGLPREARVVILGSGRLLDVPVDELLKAGYQLCLVDVVHPLNAWRLARREGRIRLLSEDVTGNGEKAGCSVCGPGVALTVSCNLLSQLPVNAPTGADKRLILEAHLDWLAQLKGRRCLITDSLRIHRRRGGTERESSLEGLQLRGEDARWEWELAPEGEIARGESLSLEVQAWKQFRRRR